MTDLLLALVYWIITHSQTCVAIAMAFLIGAVYGAWIQFRGSDNKKAAKREHA